jgi:hypothetical protein
MKTKKCTGCSIEKPLEEFYMRSGTALPLSRCKKCHNAAPHSVQKPIEITCAGCGGKALKRAWTKYCSKKCRPSSSAIENEVRIQESTGFKVDGLGPRKRLCDIPSAGTWEEMQLQALNKRDGLWQQNA